MSSQASSALLADAPPTTAGSPSETSSPSARPDRPLLVRDAGFWTAVLTLCNAALGAGLLSLPYAVASAGLLVGSLSTCVLICASFASLCVIMGLMAQAGPSVTSFGGLVRWGCGPAASNVVDGFVFLNSFGACVGYLVLLGDVVPPIVLDAVPAAKSMSAGQLRAAAASVASLPCLLLSMLRRISALRFTAGVAVFACFFTAGLLTAQAVQHPCRPGDCYDGAGRNGWCTAAQAANASSAAACYADRPTAGVSLWPESVSGLLRAFPLLMNAMQCHIQAAAAAAPAPALALAQPSPWWQPDHLAPTTRLRPPSSLQRCGRRCESRGRAPPSPPARSPSSPSFTSPSVPSASCALARRPKGIASRTSRRPTRPPASLASRWL